MRAHALLLHCGVALLLHATSAQQAAELPFVVGRRGPRQRYVSFAGVVRRPRLANVTGRALNGTAARARRFPRFRFVDEETPEDRLRKAAEAKKRAAAIQASKAARQEAMRQAVKEVKQRAAAKFKAARQAARAERQTARRAASERATERNRLEARRIRKWCGGVAVCEPRCAAAADRWAKKCTWADSCCGCVQCALKPHAMRSAPGGH